MTVNEMKEKTAILILAYAEYESLELALATHAKFTIPSGVDIYILQNGRGTYDCERTYQVAMKYHYLFPRQIQVIEDIPSGLPYHSICSLLYGARMQKYEYIIKMDDDVLVISENWVEKLMQCFIEKQTAVGEKLAYVTSLVNNNPLGFQKLIEGCENLSKTYFEKIARDHMIGCSIDNTYSGYRVMPKDEIDAGGHGTIWRNSYIVRWLHQELSLQPERFVELTRDWKPEQINNKVRYSINCLLFRKELWRDLTEGKAAPEIADDEFMLHKYCLRHNKEIWSDLSIPMVHIAFNVQREECRDMIDEFKKVYEEYLQLPFAMFICNNRLIDIENRIRFLEQKQILEKKKELEERKREEENSPFQLKNNMLMLPELDEPIYLDGVYIKMINKINRMFPKGSLRRRLLQRKGQ